MNAKHLVFFRGLAAAVVLKETKRKKTASPRPIHRGVFGHRRNERGVRHTDYKTQK